MAYHEQVEILKLGVTKWNEWRIQNSETSIDLSDVNFHHDFPDKSQYYETPHLEGCNFSHANLNRASFRSGTYINCCFDGSDINFSDFVDGYFQSCSFKNVSMRVCALGSATFNNCTFENSDLSYSTSEETCFDGSIFIDSKLENMSFVSTNFNNTRIEGCFVFGISSWDLSTKNSVQKNLIITKQDQPTITTDNLELSQFLYLIINNRQLRNIIDTISSKVVLILGNFSPERKRILNMLRDKLRDFDYIPVLFDFPKPSSRNLTETVLTLAHISKFVIADLSCPRSIGHELSAIIPRLHSVNFYPIIAKNETPYGMFEEFENYINVKPIKSYDDNLIHEILKQIIENEN